MSESRQRDWLKAPQAWGAWGPLADQWFSELATNVQEGRVETPSGMYMWFDERDISGTQRMQRRYEMYDKDGTATSLETIFNGTRTGIEDNTARTWYASDGGSGLFQINRTVPAVYSYDGSAVLTTATGANFTVFQSDGTSVLMRADRSAGYVNIRTVRSGTINPYSGWTDFGSAFSPWIFYVNSEKHVFLEGLVKNTSGGIKAANASMFLMSTAYFPGRQLIFNCMTSVGAARCDLATNGVFSCTVAIPNNGWVSISGVDWQADPTL